MELTLRARMAKKFLPYSIEQRLLLPPDLRPVRSVTAVELEASGRARLEHDPSRRRGVGPCRQAMPDVLLGPALSRSTIGRTRVFPGRAASVNLFSCAIESSSGA
jgi:hypothetical protein